MTLRRGLYLTPPILGFVGLLLPWFQVSTDYGLIQQYYPWGIYSGGYPYIFNPFDLFDLPFFFILITCLLAIIIQFIGALNPRLAYTTLIGAVLSLAGAVNWSLVLTEIVTPTVISGPGYHYKYMASSWGLGLYLTVASGVLAFITYSTQKVETR